jgi:hypothetical protein
MVDAIVQAIDGRAVVQVQGNELLLPYIANAAAQASSARAARDAAYEAVDLAAEKSVEASQYAAAASALANRFASYSAGLAGTQPGQDFTVVANDGTYINVYRNGTSTGSGDPIIQLPGKAAYEGAAGAGLIGYAAAGTGIRPRDALDKLRERRTILDYVGGVPDGVTSNRQAFLNMLADGGGIVPWQPQPYVIDDTVLFPVGATLLIEPGVRILWDGETPENLGVGVAVFRVSGDNLIACTGGQGSVFTVECAVDTPTIAVVAGFSVNNVTVIGAFAKRCIQVHLNLNTGPVSYDDAITSGKPGANTNRFIKIVGGGCRFDTSVFEDPAIINGSGAALFYCEDAEVREADYVNAYCGVQYWGGDSGFGAGQQGSDPDAERKSKRIRIINCTTRDTTAGFWGSFGDDVTVEGCRSYNCHDVAHDHEGSQNVMVSNCYAENSYNGNYVTFALTRNGITYQNCVSMQSIRSRPHLRCYNASLSAGDNQGIVWRGGRFETTDLTGPGVLDTGFGPAGLIAIENATLINTRIDFTGLNNQVRVIGNDFHFPFVSAGPFAAVKIAGIAGNSLQGRAIAIIEGNRVRTTAPQPAGTELFHVSVGDFNFADLVVIASNIAFLPNTAVYSPIYMEHTGTNPGTASRFRVINNEMLGQIQTRSTGGVPGVFSGRNNFDENDTPIPLTPV